MTVIYGYCGDEDTRVLANIWDGFGADVYHTYIDSQATINKAIADEREILIFAGHGSPQGLFSKNGYALSKANVNLVNAEYVIGIWCHAKEFAKSVGLKGFFSAMYISNLLEAKVTLGENQTYMLSDKEIWESETRFSRLLNIYIGDKKKLTNIRKWPEMVLKDMPPSNVVEQYNHMNLEYLKG